MSDKLAMIFNLVTVFLFSYFLITMYPDYLYDRYAKKLRS